MAGTSTKTKPVAVRMPVDLADWIETQGKAGDVIVRAVRALKDGPAQTSPLDAHLVPELQAEVASLRAEVKRLCALSVDTVKQAVAKPIAHHAAGPVLPATGLPVRGTARPLFRPGTNADKAAKSG